MLLQLSTTWSPMSKYKKLYAPFSASYGNQEPHLRENVKFFLIKARSVPRKFFTNNV